MIHTFTPEEKNYIDWMKRPAKLSTKKAHSLIHDLEEAIDEYKAKMLNARSRIQRNGYYNQINNRKAQITWALHYAKSKTTENENSNTK